MRRSVLASWLLCTGALAAQQPAPAGAGRPPVTVHGLAFDSLRGVPLGGAFVTLDDGSRSTQADSSGRFEFDDVALGVHTFAIQHAVLDSTGLTGVATRVAIDDPPAAVVIATPSFATLWRGFCGDGRPSADAGLVFGTVADARSGHRVANASVDLSWVQLQAGGKRATDITQTPGRGIGHTSPDGAYAICGTPVGIALRIRALTDSTTSASIDLMPAELRVRRRDLLVGPAADSSPSARGARGTVVGIVTNPVGAPVAGARVVLDEAREIRSGDDGRFVLPDVPAGTRQLEVLAIGMSPFVAPVDVVAHDTATIAAQLRKITTLDVVRVTASRSARLLVAELEERQRSGFGYIRDSTFVAGHGTLAGVFAEFPGAQLELARGTATGAFRVTMRSMTGMGRCTAPVWIDGAKADYDWLMAIRPEEIAVVEVYPRSFEVPIRYTSNNFGCGVIAVWTKRMFK